MIVMKVSYIVVNRAYHRVDSLEEISDEIRFIGKDGNLDVYFGKDDDIYFVEESRDGKMDGNK